MAERVLLTGISGYIGQHCAAELLDQGFEVIGTVRSVAKAEATRSAISEVAPVGRLSFKEADLLSDEGWEEAMEGCTYVMHVASPFVL
ncbi:MAG: NAD-dependent epimerase/dehydratase family protein, partial [Actinomycetes bacterium]